MNQKKLTSRFLTILMVVALLLTGISCTDTETTDSTNFTIYYSGMTDIGPSMNGVISSPTYIGSQPHDFSITQVTLNGESFTNESFTIDPDNGSISIANTAGIPVGLYSISVVCVSGGKTFEFKDVVTVNMMAAVPEGITVEPAKIQVEYGDVIDPAAENELPTAQVTTDGNHVSIRKYEIAEGAYSKFFAVSQTGEISIVRGSKDIVPGVYMVSLKLTTGASGEDEGIFENALEVNITSKPLELTYTPASGKIEEESELSGKTTFASNAPELKGSLEGLVFSISKVTPETSKIKIDPKTGVLSIDTNHGLKAGEKYTVDVNVVNQFAAEGVNFESVFEIEVVEYIAPIANFAYANTEQIQATAFQIAPADGFEGDEVKFEFADLPVALQGQLSLTHEGTVVAQKGNSIPLGTHTVKVKATNPKSTPEAPSVATFTITVKENPNYFTYVRYGNNLSLTPAENYANQFRIAAGGSLSDVSPVPATDAKVDLYYEITSLHQSTGTTIDPVTGKITLAGLAKKQCAIVMVTATAGKGTAAEVSVKTPVFFHYSDASAAPGNTGEQVLVEYTPFVLQVNPNKGARSVQPNVTGVNDMANLTMDYRRNFNYYNFFGNHVSGQPNKGGSFLQGLWNSYAEAVGANPNYGSRNPMSYYANPSNTPVTLAYVDPATYSVVVNPNKWVLEGDPANGAMIGQITFATNGKDPASGSQIFPIVLWFDTMFN